MQVLPIIDRVINTLDSFSQMGSAHADMGGGGAFADIFKHVSGSSSIASRASDIASETQDVLAGNRDMRLGNEELNQLRETLRAKGVSEESLEQINQLIASGQMPTLGQVFNMLRSGGLPVEFSANEEQSVLSALQKIGFNRDEAEKLTGLMAEGKGRQAWQLVNKRINEMGADGESSDFFPDELAALMKGMGGSKKLMQGLGNLFQDSESLSMNALGLKAALSGLADEIAKKNLDDSKIANNLQGALSEAAQKIKERQSKEALSDKRGNREIERAEYLMKDKLTAKANGLSEAPASGGVKHQIQPLSQQMGGQAGGEEFQQQAHERELKNKEAVSKKAASAEEQGKSKNADSKKSDPLADLFSKIEATPIAVQSPINQSASVAASLGKNAEGMRQSAFHEAIFSQVEQGLLQKLSNGASQLVLRLDPIDLGQLTLLVAVNNDEVRATLRAESPQAAQSLQDQLPRIQALLESQGFRVQKLDVQTQTPDQHSENSNANSNSWQSLSQHNASQEKHEEALRQMFARNNGNGRNGKNGLAQDMQNTPGELLNAAEISRMIHSSSSLYVVA